VEQHRSTNALKLAWEAYCEKQYHKVETICMQILFDNPNSAGAYNILGITALDLKQYEIALEMLITALEIEPNNAELLYNLSLVCLESNLMADAIYYARKAIEKDKTEVHYHEYLAKLLIKTRKLNEAVELYRNALEYRSDKVDLWEKLASLYLYMRNPDEAAIICMRALELHPENTKLLQVLGRSCMEQGNVGEALRIFDNILEINPDNIVVNWYYHLALPVVYKDENEVDLFRKKYIEGLDYLTIKAATFPQERIDELIIACTSKPNFFITYQGKNDLEIQKKYGKLISIITDRSKLNEKYRGKHPQRPLNKIKVGFISNYLCNNTCGSLFIGWLDGYDKEKYEVYSYHLGTIFDEISKTYSEKSTCFRHLQGSIESICKQIIEDSLDVLVYLDIGIHATAAVLASIRMAPIQCVAWAQPITTGLNTIDYFLSSDLMEPTNAQSHYTENLVLLPNISIKFDMPVQQDLLRRRTDLNIEENECMYISCQSLYKYLPRFDYIYPEIVRRSPKSKIVFIQYHSHFATEIFVNRLNKSFASYGLQSSAYCIFLPRQSHEEFVNILQLSDVYLDTLAWSGGRTTLEAVACGLPIVTYPGEFMRGRHSYAILKMMGVEETIADSQDQYIEIAARLGFDYEYRSAISDKVARHKHRVYNDHVCVERLYGLFEEWMK
jgi:predicted O-linked N-acetylglucosamine transferase (SPINDLY family)